MLHTKFQCHQSVEQLFVPKGPRGCIRKFVTIGPVVSGEKPFEIVNGRKTSEFAYSIIFYSILFYEFAYSINSPGAFGSGELKKHYLHVLNTEPR